MISSSQNDNNPDYLSFMLLAGVEITLLLLTFVLLHEPSKTQLDQDKKGLGTLELNCFKSIVKLKFFSRFEYKNILFKSFFLLNIAL